jgi:hypothetical protein
VEGVPDPDCILTTAWKKAKKWRLEIFISTRHSETHFELKT